MKVRVIKQTLSYAGKKYAVGEEFEATNRYAKMLVLVKRVEEVKEPVPSRVDAFERAIAAKKATPTPAPTPEPKAMEPEPKAMEPEATEPPPSAPEQNQPEDPAPEEEEKAPVLTPRSNRYKRRDVRSEN